MKVTYIHHSCFSVETKEVVLLFDYYKGDIPEFPLNKPVFVFSSHKHHDHFNFKIFDLAEQYPHVVYILSHDIRMNESYMDRKNISPKVRKNLVFMNKDDKISFSKGLFDSICIRTLQSNDAGVAFIIKIGEKQIYHAGDLNWWYWEDEEKQINNQLRKIFLDEIEKIKGEVFDAAFLPLDPRMGDKFHMGFDYFMSNTNTKHGFPMHLWGDYSAVKRLQNKKSSEPYLDRIISIKKEGEVFEI